MELQVSMTHRDLVFRGGQDRRAAGVENSLHGHHRWKEPVFSQTQEGRAGALPSLLARSVPGFECRCGLQDGVFSLQGQEVVSPVGEGLWFNAFLPWI